MIQSKALRRFGVVLPLALLVAVAVISALGLGQSFIFNPLGLIAILHTIFLTGIGIIIAIVSARSYLRQGNLSILLLGVAALTLAVAGLLGGILLSNYGTIINNIGICASSVVQVISGIVTFAVVKSSEPTKRKTKLAAAYLGVVAFITALTAVTFSGIMPVFLTPQGPTLIRTTVLGVTVFLFASSCVLFFWRYQQSKVKTLYWYSLALGLFAIAFLSFMLQTQLADTFGWIGRIAEYSGSIFFIVALLQPSIEVEASADLSERWAKAFRSNREQVADFFSRMLDSFAYFKILINKEGKPIDYIFLDINEAFEKFTGLNKKDILGKKASEIMNSDALEDWLSILGPVALTGEAVTMDHFSKFSKKWVHMTIYSPQKSYLVSIFEDITKRKKAEEALRESEERLRFHAENTPLAVVEWDNNFVVTRWAGDAEKIFGWNASETIGKPIMDLHMIYEPDLPMVEKTMSRLTSGDIKVVSSNRNVTKDGRVIYCTWFNSVLIDINKKMISVFSFVEDHTARVKAEEALKESEQLYHSVFDNSQDGFQLIELVYDKNGKPIDHKFLLVNHAYEKIIGVKAEDILDKTAKYISPNQEPHWLEVPDRVAKTGISEHVELYNKDINKTLDCFYFLYSKRVVGTLFRDITERKNLEKQLQDSERLAAIGATAGMVGHDIRNPLQAITGDLFLAKSELFELPDNENKANVIGSLDEIQNNIDYINKIVADLQDYARPLNPRAQEADVELVFSEILAKKGVPENIEVSIDVEAKAKRIMADPDYLKRIAANLTLNAVQAMPKGGKLTIHAYIDKASLDVLITVKDTGVGIPEDIKPKLFTPMMTTKSKGQGFGLAVVKRMTEGLGGTVTCESQEGKGTTFIVRLPPPHQELNAKWNFK